MATSQSAYRAPAWLPGGNLQTLYPALLARRPAVRYRRERWDAPDGDFIDLDWTADPAAPGAPLLVLFHGLEGSSNSHYARALMYAVAQRRWLGVVAHFRGCGGALNRLPRAYHSGDSAEIDWVLRRLLILHPQRPRYAVGVSLGGNALLKWLGERETSAAAIVRAAAAVSAPVDLHAAGDALERGFNRVYTKNFLWTMKRSSLARLAAHPRLFDAEKMLATRTLREFDDLVTAPLHGFRDVDDYYTRASSKPHLARIGVPTLLLNARNDPFMPAVVLPAPDTMSPAVTAEFPETGGHAGFISGAFPGSLDWLPRRLIGFLSTIKSHN
ncbi:MAG: hydrolase [Burkholderiales bacterium]|nr:hydrolase [Burkholderiales bacterium]